LRSARATWPLGPLSPSNSVHQVIFQRREAAGSPAERPGTYETSHHSIPIALSEMTNRGLLKAGDLILTFGFGAGLTYGGNLIRW
jgi:hypothetical protein